jgi:membrane protein DedA with SNARE-associated domain
MSSFLHILQDAPVITVTTDFLLNHPYVMLFFGLVVAGETILIPAIFLAITGQLDMTAVFGVALLTTILSDTIWYFLGVYMPTERLRNLSILEKRQGLIKHLEHFFKRYSEIILFSSKYVYGTRVTVQILSGIHRMPFLRYQLVNLLGVASWTGLLIGIAFLVHNSVNRLTSITHTLQWSFLGFVCIFATISFSIRYSVRKWFQ